MSTNVGEIDLSLVLNSDKFSSQLNNVDKQANMASTRITSSLGKIFCGSSSKVWKRMFECGNRNY